jgi:flagellar hook-basal body complex protein FliE
MAGISSIQGIGGAMPALQPTAPQKDQAPKGFGDVLKAAVNSTDARQKAAAQAIQDYVAGKTTDSLPVVNELAKADMSFKLLIGVRNKMIDAYKETMRMQI